MRIALVSFAIAGLAFAQETGGGTDYGDVQTFTLEERLIEQEASDRQMMLDRREAAEIGDRIGRQAMSRDPAGDVATVSRRSPAVTVKGGKFVFIRGLGERYSQTLLNRANIPSPEPDKRVVPLDLFPTSLIESVNIARSYSPDMPGEFSGGSVQIKTIDVPLEAFFRLSLGVKYRDGTTLEDFETYDGGRYDYFGFDDGTRDLPSEVPGEEVRETFDDRGFSPEEVQRIGRSFKNVWESRPIAALPEHKLSLSFGRRFGEPGGGQLGIVGALNWGNKYQTIEDETFRILKNNGSIASPNIRVFNDFDLNSYKFEAEVSGVLNLVYEINPAQKVGVRNLFTRVAEDRVRTQSGIDGQQDRAIEVTQLRYVERTLWFTQAFGEHLLEGDTFLDWRLSYSLSQRDEPDNRQVRYDFQDFDQDFVLENVSGSGRRDYYLLDENIYDGGIDYAIPFAPFVKTDPDPDRLRPKQKIQLGLAATLRDRDFDARRFRFVPRGSPVDEFGNRIDLTAPPEEIFQPENIHTDGFVLDEKTRSTDNYEAEQTLLAGYLFTDVLLLKEKPAVETLRLQLGGRIENSDQEVTTFRLFGENPEEVEAKIDKTDFLPALNLTWEFVKAMQVRLSASRTVSRPEFRELAEFEFTDVAQGFKARGNPDLKRGRLWNFDLRWEWFPAPADVVSVGVFYKLFEDPIEEVIIPTGSSLLKSWDNADSADLWGVEFEVRKNLGFLGEWTDGPQSETFLRDFSLLFNYALIDSEVKLTSEQDAILTNGSRELQGQPEFTLNTGLLYDSTDLGLTVAVLANTFGERISAVGAFGLPDEKEESRWSLDVSIAKKFGRSTVKLTAQNILDDKFSFKQGSITTREFRRGFSIGLSYSVSF